MEVGNLSKKSGHNMRIHLSDILHTSASNKIKQAYTRNNKLQIKSSLHKKLLPPLLSLSLCLFLFLTLPPLSSTKHLIYTDHMYIPRVAYLPPPSFNLIWGDEFNRGKTTSIPPPSLLHHPYLYLHM